MECGSNGEVLRGEKQDKAQQQLYAELQLESQMSKQRIEDEMHQEIAQSAAHGQRERAALQQKQEARVRYQLIPSAIDCWL